MKKILQTGFLFIWLTALMILPGINDVYAQGSGSALEFDGVDDYVLIPSDSTDELNPLHEVTIESWIYLSEAPSATHRPHYLGKFGSYQLVIETNGLPRFFTREGSNWLSATGTTTIEMGKWYHIAATFDSLDIRIYVNGKMEGVPISKTVPLEQNPNDVLLGGRFGGTASLAGSLDEIRIWGVARTEAELQNGMSMKLAGNESELLGYWRLDEGTGTITADLTANGNDGTLTNMDATTDWVTSIAPVGDASLFAESAHIAETSICEVDVVFGTDTEAPGLGYSLNTIQVNESPNDLTGLEFTLAEMYWEIWSEVVDFDGNFTASVQFHYDNVSGINNESDLVLYRRDNADAATWSTVTGYSIVTDDGASSSETDGIGYIQLNLSESTPGGFAGQYMLGWNIRPVANDDADSTIEETLVVIDVLDNDSDTESSLDASTVSISADPSNGSITDINTSTGEITYTPDLNFSGTDQFTYTVDDDGGATSNIATVSVYVESVNDPPVVTDIPDETIAEGETFATINLDDFVTDPDDADSLITWTWSGNSDLTVTIDGSRVATIGIPDENWNGNESIVFTATDQLSEFDSDSATFTVTPVNDAPVIADIPDQTIDEGETFTTINLDDYVSDIDDNDSTILWNYSGNTDLTVTIDGSRGATIGIPDENWYGNEDIIFVASDSDGADDSDTVSFTVNSVNDLPVVTDIPDESIAEGDSFTAINLDDFVSDVEDSISSITWTWSGNSDLTVSIDNNRVATISIPDENWYGNETITFIATDLDDGEGSDMATFTVTPYNDPPVVSDIPDQTIDEGDAFATIDLDDFVTDIDDPDTDIIWSWSGNTDLIVSIDNRVATIGIPDENWNGNETITFTAFDHTGSDASDAATFTILPLNDAPVVVTQIPDTSGATLEEFIFQFDSQTFNDIDEGDSLAYTAGIAAGELPEWLSFDATIRTFSGTPETEDVGLYSVIVTAHDLDMESVTDTFEIQIIRGVLGIADIVEWDLNVYPNPAEDFVVIEFEQIEELESIEFYLYDIVGNRMSIENRIGLNANRVEIDLNHIPAGMYIMLIQNNSHLIKYKLSKN